LDLRTAALLGVLQGVTEFLPISSSAHLALARAYFLGLDEAGMRVFDVGVHVATLLAMLWLFRRDVARIVTDVARGLPELVRGRETTGLAPTGGRATFDYRPGLRTALLVAVGTVPAVAIALAFGHALEQVAEHPRLIGATLLGNATMLFLSARWRHGTRTLERLRARDALLIGLAQSLALWPGVSRSGITITTGLFLGIAPRDAARFSFLLGIVAISGAFVLEGRKLGGCSSRELQVVGVGALCALVTGFLALRLLMKVVGSAWFSRFGFYTLALGLWAVTRKWG
jgi:undecaprenyl-diphosphatase